MKNLPFKEKGDIIIAMLKGDNPTLISTLIGFTMFFIGIKILKIHALVFLLPIIMIFCLHSILKNYGLNSNLTINLKRCFFAVVLIIQILFSLIFLFVAELADVEKIYDDIKNYNNALETVGEKKYVNHFPKSITPDAKNVVLYKQSFAVFGGDIVYLRFQASDEYIMQEINNHKYIKTLDACGDKDTCKEQYIKRKYIFDEKESDYRTKIDGFKIYIIGNYETSENCHLTCEYGIAVNRNSNTIIYYLSNPD